MRSHIFRLRRCLGRDRGFTLIEIVIACAIIGIGLVPVAYGLMMGIQNVETGRQQSTAIFLAQQRMDQVRAAALIATEPPLANVTAAAFPAEATFLDFPGFRRTVTLTTYLGPAGGLPAGLTGIRVDVDVFYTQNNQMTARPSGTNPERSVRLSNLVASR
jgi:prepilin-type N-terminal cleavage/methylation domain-containing protein